MCHIFAGTTTSSVNQYAARRNTTLELQIEGIISLAGFIFSEPANHPMLWK